MSSSGERLRVRRPTGRYRYVRWRWHILFGIVDWIGDALRGWMRGTAKRRDRSKDSSLSPRRVLLIQLDHMGDAVITSAMLPALRDHWPNARIEVLAAPWNRDVFDNCPEVDAVHISCVNRFARGWRPHWILAVIYWGLRLRRQRFDVGIDPRGEFPFAALLWFAGVKQRVGWNCGGGGFLLTDSAKFVPGRPEMQSRMALLELLGVKVPNKLRTKSPWFTLPTAARANVHAKLTATANSLVADFMRGQTNGDDTCRNSHEFCCGPLIVFHIGAGTAAKRWPATRWQELLGRMLVEYGPRIVLVGGASDWTTAIEILDGKIWPGVSDWTGQLSVVETAALIERADIFVGADSGPAHLAAAVGTPAVVLFSGTNRSRQWRPWGQRIVVAKHDVACAPCHRRRCPLANHPCMNGILPEMVMEQVRAVLEPGKSSAARIRDPAIHRRQSDRAAVIEASYYGMTSSDDAKTVRAGVIKLRETPPFDEAEAHRLDGDSRDWVLNLPRGTAATFLAPPVDPFASAPVAPNSHSTTPAPQ